MRSPGLPFNGLHPRSPRNYTDYYSFTDLEDGKVRRPGWLTLSGHFPTKWSHVSNGSRKVASQRPTSKPLRHAATNTGTHLDVTSFKLLTIGGRAFPVAANQDLECTASSVRASTENFSVLAMNPPVFTVSVHPSCCSPGKERGFHPQRGPPPISTSGGISLIYLLIMQLVLIGPDMQKIIIKREKTREK